MKAIIYIDMNSFFVSCHQVKNPNLKNKPVVVSGDSRRAVVCSASYEARKYNIKSAMPLYQAKILCPWLIKVNIEHELYAFCSAKIFSFLEKQFTTNIEICSIDEYCLDVTNIYRKYGSVLKCAQIIQKTIFNVFQLPCSIGISFTTFLAKMASKTNKPNGIFMIKPSELPTKIWLLPIQEMHGIGQKTAIKLKSININTIGELVIVDNYQLLKKVIGKKYLNFINQAQGKVLEIPVASSKIIKSVGCDLTLEYDSSDEDFLKIQIKKMTKTVAQRASALSLVGRVIVFGFKVNSARWMTKQISLQVYINNYETIFDTVIMLFSRIWKQQQIRALRISLKKVTKQYERYVQLNLFSDLNLEL